MTFEFWCLFVKSEIKKVHALRILTHCWPWFTAFSYKWNSYLLFCNYCLLQGSLLHKWSFDIVQTTCCWTLLQLIFCPIRWRSLAFRFILTIKAVLCPLCVSVWELFLEISLKLRLPDVLLPHRNIFVSSCSWYWVFCSVFIVSVCKQMGNP